jgi:hypothetical protein
VGEKAETRRWGVCLHTLLQESERWWDAWHDIGAGYEVKAISGSMPCLMMEVMDMQVPARANPTSAECGERVHRGKSLNGRYATAVQHKPPRTVRAALQ